MDSSGSGLRKFITSHLGTEMSDQPLQEQLEEMNTNPVTVSQVPETEVTSELVQKRSINELLSTSDSERCGAYCTYKRRP